MFSDYEIGKGILVALTTSSAGEDEVTLNFVRSLTDAEFIDFKSSKSILEKWVKETDEAFASLELAYNKVIGTYVDLEAAHQQKNRPPITQSLFVMNEALIEFLAKMKSYIDHADRRISRANLESELHDFRKYCSMKFDSSFPYCFSLKLRDFTLHNSQPISIVNATSSIQDPMGTFNISFARSYLLEESSKWGAVVKPQLEKMPETFEVIPVISRAVEDIYDIHKVLIQQYWPRVKPHYRLLHSLYSEVNSKNPDGQPLIVTRRKNNTDHTTSNLHTLEFIKFPDAEMQFLQSLETAGS